MSKGSVTHGAAGPPWSGVPESMTLYAPLAMAAEGSHKNQPALIFEDGLSLTPRQMYDSARRFCAYLDGRLEPNRMVAIALDNRAEFLYSFFGALMAGARVTLIDPAVREADGRHVLTDCAASTVVVDPGTSPAIMDIVGELPTNPRVLTLSAGEPEGLDRYLGKPLVGPRDGIQSTDPSIVVYTSGSTGLPKGCVCDHRAFTRVLDLVARLGMGGERERHLTPSPFFYTDAIADLMAAFHFGSVFVAMRRFSVSRFWPVVSSTGVTSISSIGSIPTLLMKSKPRPVERQHRVKYATQLGIPPDLHAEMVERWGFPWLDAYGSMEGGAISRVPMPYAEEMVGSGSMGVPYPDVEVSLRNDAGDEVELGDVGEIFTRGPGMFKEYINQPDATDEVLQDGWYRSGDLGSRDDRGFLYFSGRSKDIIRRSGENVSAAEVESVLRSHPFVRDAAVIAVPDPLMGEEIKALVQLVDSNGVTESSMKILIDHCAARLARRKVPRYISLVTDDFPRTASMRVKKDVLRRLDRAGAYPAWDRERPAGGLM